MRLHVATPNGPRLSHAADIALRTAAVVYALAGAAMLLFTEVNTVTAFSLIAVGGALAVVVETDKRRRGGTSH